MQNWDTMQTTANYVEHNNWYNNMFAANIKTEPGTSSPISQNQQNSPAQSNASCTTHLENFLKQHQQQYSAMDTNMTTLTPSPSSSGNNANGDQQQQQFFDATSMHHQQMMQKQQQQYQQYFQHAQQVASQNQVTTHLPLGFKPLTPPGLPQAILPAMPHFYPQSNQTQRNQQQTPSPQLLDAAEKSDLTPRHTPPMDITPPKSPKVPNLTPTEKQQDQELMSNCSEDLKCTADSEDDENIRTPIYNSHGKIKNYRCKSCGSNAITKLAFWEHAKTHMKPEKILQCPKCPFVTELKHHLEYHIRKHKNIKPFQCDKCTYTCVSKSMLISHRKSHSSVYPYRCDGCDYVTKYCHSFKLHLRKYDHKPGVVLDEDGIPNPSVVIDVYGTRRGPKSKGSVSGSNTKKANNDLKMSAHHSQLSAALQGFAINNNQQNQISDTSANVNPTVASELPALTLNMSLQQQQQQQQQSNTNQNSNNQQQSQNSSQNDNITNLLPPLATILPYINYNFNIQMLAQQQLALAQLSPRLREQLQKHQQQLELNQAQNQAAQDGEDLESDNKEDEDDDQEFDSKSVDSAMDLSQGTPTKEDGQQQQTPAYATNLKLPEDNIETPLFSSTTSTRRKGRVLKLDQEHKKQSTTNTQQNSAPTSPQKDEMPTTSSPIATSPASTKVDEQSSADESMETNTAQNNPSNTSSASAASSSGNSSNSSSTVASNSNNSPENSSPSVTPTMYECQYCPIIFKDPVMYTIHKGYHSCDDVFKCNMCGEKCDGYLSLFVHMARNAHS